MFNRKVVMDDKDAAKLCTILKPRLAIPIHYKFTAGPARDRAILKYTGTAEGFADAVSRNGSTTRVKILTPDESVELNEDDAGV